MAQNVTGLCLLVWMRCMMLLISLRPIFAASRYPLSSSINGSKSSIGRCLWLGSRGVCNGLSSAMLAACHDLF